MPQNDTDADLAIKLQQQEEQQVGFAVEPITNCPHLPTLTTNHPVYIDRPCQACGDVVENWQCLTCDAILCSRYRQAHMGAHVEESGHFVCLSYSDLSVWCFACDSYVTHQSLDDVKHKAYVSKFNEEPPTRSTISTVQEQDQASSSY